MARLPNGSGLGATLRSRSQSCCSGGDALHSCLCPTSHLWLCRHEGPGFSAPLVPPPAMSGEQSDAFHWRSFEIDLHFRLSRLAFSQQQTSLCKIVNRSENPPQLDAAPLLHVHAPLTSGVGWVAIQGYVTLCPLDGASTRWCVREE